MTWTSFKKYIQKKYLRQEEFSSQIALNEATQTKYSAQAEELTTILTNLFLSIDNYFTTGFGENKFHNLPALREYTHTTAESDNESDDDNDLFIKSPKISQERIKTWNELFPSKENMLWGKAENEEIPSQEVAQILSNWYELWAAEEEKTEQNYDDYSVPKGDSRDSSSKPKNEKKTNLLALKKESQELEKLVEKLMMEWAGTQAQKFLKSKGINLLSRFKKWLTNYEKLDYSGQKDLKNAKDKIEEIVPVLEKGKVSEEETAQTTSQTNFWDVAKWVGGGFVILFGISLIIKLLKGK